MSGNSHLRLSLPGSILAGAVLMFAMPLGAQAASYTYIDQKAPYANSGMLTALNLPKVGTTFKVQVPGSHGYWSSCGWWSESRYPCVRDRNYYLAFGTKNPNIRIPGLYGFLFTSAEIVLPTPYVGGSPRAVTMSFPIPNSSQLLGVGFYQQVLLDDTGWWGWQWLSRGGYGVIGK